MNGDQTLLFQHARRLNVGGIVVAVAVLFATWFFVMRSIEDEIKTTRMRLAEQAHYITTSPATIEKEAAIHARVQDIRQLHDTVVARIPDAPQANEFLHLLEDIAKESDFVIRNYTPRETQSYSAWSVQHFHVTGQGSYAAICRFLIGLETQPRLSRVNDLSISTDKNTDTCTLTLVVAAYFAPRLADAGLQGDTREN